MKYHNTVKGKFEARPNRFVAQVQINGKSEIVHVKNTGGLRELLVPGADVVLAAADKPNRKTKYDLISVYKPNLGWVNIDSQATNKVTAEWLTGQGYTFIKPEYRYGVSRLDFYMEKGEEKFLMEVKGCTLEMDGFGWFPDLKSVRAVRHVKELTKAISEGYHSIVAFVIAMEGVTEVRPNIKKDPDFGEALEEAKKAGVEVWYLSCAVSEDSLYIIEKFDEGCSQCGNDIQSDIKM